MKKISIVVLFFLSMIHVVAQDIKMLDGKWAFSGSRTTVFTVKNDTLFVSLVDDGDLKNFETFCAGQSITDPALLSATTISRFNGKLQISAMAKRKQSTYLMTFIYDQRDSLHIHYVGDVYYGDKKVPYTNQYCDTLVPYCTNRLYSKSDIVRISKLKPLEIITKPEILELFKRHEAICKTKCNKCFEGFPGADINGILIEMGYNPVYKKPRNDSYTYSVSASSFIMDKYRDDPEIKEATNYFKEFLTGKPQAETDKK
jgi:hypothetical protein